MQADGPKVVEYKKEICKIVIDNKFYPDDLNLEINPINKVEYTLGVKYYDNGILYLFHNDVINLFTILLDREKFRNIFKLCIIHCNSNYILV